MSMLYILFNLQANLLFTLNTSVYILLHKMDRNATCEKKTGAMNLEK